MQHKKLLLLLAFMLSMWQARAQAPFIYTTVSAGSQTLTSQTLSDTVQWYRWSNYNNSAVIDIKMTFQGAEYKLRNARAYIDYGTSFERIAADTLRTDSLIELRLNNLSAGSDIYVSVPTVYCGTCTATSARVNIYFKDITSSCTPYTAPNCELVADGGAEYSNITCSSLSIGMMPCYWTDAQPDTSAADLGTFHGGTQGILGTSDYYNTCAPTAVGGCPNLQCVVNGNTNFSTNGLGPIAPHSGNGYLGAYMYMDSLSSTGGGYNGRYREYLTQQLHSPMLAGITYNASMWVRIADISKYALYNFHMLCTPGPVIQPIDTTVLDVINIPIPTNAGAFAVFPSGLINDTAHWTQISTTITPSVNCSYITIGNFYNKGNSSAVDRNPSMSWTYASTQSSVGTHQGCAYYYFDDISITPQTIGRDTSITICAGTSYTLGTSPALLPPGISYTWTAIPPDPTLSAQTHSAQPVVTPTTTTVYQMAASTCGPAWTTTLVPTPIPTVAVVASSTAICAGGSSTLTASGSTNYTWTPGASTSSVIVVTPTVSNVYTVTASNGAVCHTTATVQVLFMGSTCCQAPNVTIGTSPTSTVTIGTSYSSQIINIQGVVTFTANASIVGCTVRMLPNSRIQVNPGVTLTISGNSKLFSCTGMWDGIVLLKSGSSAGNLVFDRSRIEDAYKAISIDWANTNAATSGNGDIRLTTAVLNNNYVGVSIANSPSVTAYPLSIQTSSFSTRYSSTSPNNGLKPGIGYTYAYNQLNNPSVAYTAFPIGYVGVQLNNVGNKTVIGDSTLAGNANYFSFLNYGVFTTNSDIEVYNNNFSQIRGSSPFTGTPTTTLAPIGVAVAGTNNGTTVGKKHMIVGTGTLTANSLTLSPLPKGNDFSNCYMGVFSANFKNLVANGNRFQADTTYKIPCASITHGLCTLPSSPLYMSFTGGNGIYVKGLTVSALTNNNYIFNYREGITVSLNTASATASGAYVHQNYNEISSADDNDHAYCQYAINISQAANNVNLNYNAYQIIGNNITNVYNCINGNNIKGSLLIKNNPQIGVETSNNYGMTGAYHSGIMLTACDGAVIAENPLINGNGNVTSSNYPYVRGIWLQNSGNNGSFTGSKVNCNTLSNLGRTLMFSGSCLNEVSRNDMTNHFQGLVLSNNGYIGQQGSTSLTNDNVWHTLGSGGSAMEGETYTENTSGVNGSGGSFLFVKPNGVTKTEPTYNYSNLSGQAYAIGPFVGIRPQSAGTAGVSCDADGGGGSGHKSSTINGYQANVAAPGSNMYTVLSSDTTIYSAYEDETTYQNQRLVYQLAAAGSIPAQQLNQDVQAFVDSAQNSSHAQFLSVDQQIDGGNYAAAQAANAAVAVGSTIEQYQQRINELVIKYSANPEVVFSAAELSDLYTIAGECMDRYGNVVAQARGLVYVLENHYRSFPENCTTNKPDAGRKTKSAVRPTQQTTVALFPNPNNGAMTLQYAFTQNAGAVMQLYSIDGMLVAEYKLQSTEGRLEISQQALRSGVYYYRVTNANSLIKTEKIVIIH